MNVGFISLGCSKNLIDTEMTISLFKKNDFQVVNDVEIADVIVINTCGFIDSAKQEGINTILEMAEYKNKKCKYLIVMGCLVERYKSELEKLLSEVDLFIPINEYENIWDNIEKLINKKANNYKLNYFEREVTTGNTSAYLKIAEGCSNRCTYCAIPNIRGPFISRPIEEILEEAEILAKKGYKEIIVIAQDTTKYGEDIYGKPKLAELLNEITKIEGVKWVRFLYAYPESVTDELINTVKNNNKICKYFDIPIQHISNSVLKRMNRRITGEQIEDLINKIKREIPNCILRTSLIVGFPGETEDDFEKLYKFVEKAKFDKLGVFTYSKEDGTPAARLKEQIHYKTKNKRYNIIMKLAGEISENKMKAHIGKKYEALIENKTIDNKYYIGRTYMDIPEEDGIVLIKNSTNEYKIGEWITCKIIDVKKYDLIAEEYN